MWQPGAVQLPIFVLLICLVIFYSAVAQYSKGCFDLEHNMKLQAQFKNILF